VLTSVVVKNNPNILNMKDNDVWEEKYSFDTSARRKINIWVDYQRTMSVAEICMLK